MCVVITTRNVTNDIARPTAAAAAAVVITSTAAATTMAT